MRKINPKNIVGINKEKGYLGIYLFPLGIEFCSTEVDSHISFVLFPLELCISLQKNLTLFR
tara:strand:- start:233 stop:415 length:183 start_codon:yes stop_codon:yes gene_type:complete